MDVFDNMKFPILKNNLITIYFFVFFLQLSYGNVGIKGILINSFENKLVINNKYIALERETAIPKYSGKVQIGINKNKALQGKNCLSCQVGTVSKMLKIEDELDAIIVIVKRKELVITSEKKVKTGSIPQQKILDSLPLIPKSFLEYQTNSNGNCIVRGNTAEKKIALTFDDGPSDLTTEIIAILNKYKIKGTFFWVGKNMANNKTIIKLAKKSGHLIGNHSWNHNNCWQSSNEYLWAEQVEKTAKELARCGVKNAKYYRPPFGAITQEQINSLATKGIKTVLWSLTTMDWDLTQNKEGEMFQKFKDYIHNGAIVLLHDFDFGNKDAKLKDLENMILYGKSQGYDFVTIDAIL